MEMMLKRDTSNNVNLLDEMQKAQVICIRMPEHMFTTDDEKDVYTTYWMTKIWMSLQMRKKKFEGNRDAMTKVNLVIDELYQVENTEKVLTNILSRLPKFNIKPILSCHYLNQIKYLRPELRSASASYMLIAGCDKDNYKELAEELKPFQLEDLMNLQRHESLNLIKTSNGYGRFITALPAPVNTIKKNPS
jgi:heterodisulfide reductase subunit B